MISSHLFIIVHELMGQCPTAGLGPSSGRRNVQDAILLLRFNASGDTVSRSRAPGVEVVATANGSEE